MGPDLLCSTHSLHEPDKIIKHMEALTLAYAYPHNVSAFIRRCRKIVKCIPRGTSRRWLAALFVCDRMRVRSTRQVLINILLRPVLEDRRCPPLNSRPTRSTVFTLCLKARICHPLLLGTYSTGRTGDDLLRFNVKYSSQPTTTCSCIPSPRAVTMGD